MLLHPCAQEYALDKNNDIFNYVVSTGTKPTTYEFQVKEPLFPSYATIHTAKDAMKIVTSYAGPFMPERDNRLKRNVRETLDGTYTYVGSKSGIKGEIDTEEDITEAGTTKGWEDYPEEHRPATFDTDQDGMPDWWEQCVGSDPSTANQNDDPDGDGYTLLEDYLEFMAHPYVIIEPNGQASIELSQHFRGFYGQNGASVTPTYQLDVTKGGDHITATISGSLLNVKAQSSIEPCIHHQRDRKRWRDNVHPAVRRSHYGAGHRHSSSEQSATKGK